MPEAERSSLPNKAAWSRGAQGDEEMLLAFTYFRKAAVFQLQPA